MRRFWIDSKSIEGSSVVLKGKTFHHIFRVCRFQKGQKLTLLSHFGRKYLVEVVEVSKYEAQARILGQTVVPIAEKPFIHLALSCPRLSVIDHLIPKIVELGLSDFHLFVSDFSFMRKLDSVQKKRFQRWENIAQSSAVQSLHPQGMTLHPLCSLSSVLKVYSQAERAKALFFYAGEGGRSFREGFQSLEKENLDEIWVFIGSEGGFSPNEVSIFKSYHIPPVTLGEQILKVETACLTVLGVLKYMLGQL